jgi:hypothetical protein
MLLADAQRFFEGHPKAGLVLAEKIRPEKLRLVDQ